MPSLAGLGKAGSWQVDIDNEEDADHGYPWSVTLSHPSCYIQWGIGKLEVLSELMRHLADSTQHDILYNIPGSTGAELQIGIVQERLILRVCRDRHRDQQSFYWVLETSIQIDEVSNFSIAVTDALREASLA